MAASVLARQTNYLMDHTHVLLMTQHVYPCFILMHNYTENIDVIADRHRAYRYCYRWQQAELHTLSTFCLKFRMKT